MRRLALSSEYLHFNTLIWQAPSWGFAITGGVLATYASAPNWFRDSLLAFALFVLGGGFLWALNCALIRYRHYQSAFAPDNVRMPPFGISPKANPYLQLSMCLNCAVLGVVAVDRLIFSIRSRFSASELGKVCQCDSRLQANDVLWVLLFGSIASSIIFWRYLEHQQVDVQNRIDISQGRPRNGIG
jgi:hypothetical protein